MTARGSKTTPRKRSRRRGPALAARTAHHRGREHDEPERVAQPDRAGDEADHGRSGQEAEPADRRDGGDPDAGRHSRGRAGGAEQHRHDDAETCAHRDEPDQRGGVEPITSASASPVAASRPPPRTSATGPNRAFRRSPASRLAAMASEKPV